MTNPHFSSDLFYVRIPNGQEFGPADRATILIWETQGRVNGTCRIRPEKCDQLIDFEIWKHEPAEPPIRTSDNIFGDEIGRINLPANQSVATPKSRATAVLILSLCSWLLCLSFIGAPICAMFALGFGIVELGRINRGEIAANQSTTVWAGIAIASANLAFVVIFAFYALIAAVVP